MKRLKYYLITLCILSLFLPFIKTDSSNIGSNEYYSSKNEEKLYKIVFDNFNVSDLDKIDKVLKIREIEAYPLNNIEYSYILETSNYPLSQEYMNHYYEYMDQKNSSEYLLKNNNLKIKSITILNTYEEIEEKLKGYKYKIKNSIA